MCSCFFIGHRDAPESALPALEEEVERHIADYRVTDFVVGHYGSFDAMAAGAVLRAKQRHPQVALTLLLPYPPFGRTVPVPEGFDGTFYPPGMEGAPKRLAIVRANRWMLGHCRFLIAWVSHPSGGSRQVLEAARLRERRGLLRVTNLGGPY